MGEEVSFTLRDGTKAIVQIRRNSRSKHLRLRMDCNSQLILTAPPAMDLRQIKLLSPKFLPWLEKKLQEHPGGKDQPFIPDEIYVPMLDHKYLISISQGLSGFRRESFDKDNCLLLQDGVNKIIVAARDNQLFLFGYTQREDLCVLALQEFFRLQAGRHLPPYIHRLAKQGRYENFEVMIRNQKGRWGSCSRNLERGTPKISLNWRALLLPPDLLEHLCWHELTHLRHMDHSPDFHAELAQHSPASREKERLLNTAWRELPRWTHFRG